MEIEEIKEIIREQLPRIMQSDEEVARFILRLSSQYYAGKLETEDRFDRILKELERDREEQSRRWDEQVKKWEENERRWEENAKRWEANERRWEENAKRWEANERRWEENFKRWEENDRRWEENFKRWEENDRRWEENFKRWEENDRKWEENAYRWEANDRRWEENFKRWEENDRKWEENAKRWEENDRRWKENFKRWEENDRKWEEQNKKWWENQKNIERLYEEIKVLNRKHDQSIGALGARWGLQTEASFRNALAGILQDTFKVKVLHITEFDDQGEVFGRPDQVEFDLIIKNGLLIICEIKSSMSKPDMYAFERKTRFYEKHHQCKADRKIVISPMVDNKAKNLAAELGIEVYSYAEDVERI